MTTSKKQAKKKTAKKASAPGATTRKAPKQAAKTKQAAAPRRARRPGPRERDAREGVVALTAADVDALRTQIEQKSSRWNASPEDTQKSVAQLVLTLVEFLRQLMERQAIRRMEEGSFTDDETERVGLALMKLEETLHDLCERFDLKPSDLQLNLGPLGRLL